MFCSQCGGENVIDAKFCKSCGTAINSELTPQALNPSAPETNSPENNVKYADFWRRGAAAIVDWQTLGLLCVGMTSLLKKQSADIQLIGFAGAFLLWGFSIAGNESGSNAATLGKRLFYLHVLRTDNSGLSFPRATGRFFGRIISAIMFGAGYLIQPFTAKRQTLHDMITDSVVVQYQAGRESLIALIWILQILFLAVLVVINVDSLRVKVEQAVNINLADNSTDRFADLAAATPAQLLPTGELASMFNLMSDNTDLQRENKFKQIKGKVVEWTLPVYEVQKNGDVYEVQTVADETVGAFIYITARNAQDKTIIEALKTGSQISFKGIIRDVSMRSLEIKPAILFQPSGANPVAIRIAAAAEINNAHALPSETSPSTMGTPQFVSLGTFTVNLQRDQQDEDKYLQTQLSVKVLDPSLVKRIEDVQPEIASKINLLLASKYAKDLMTIKDKSALAAKIKAETNAVLGFTNTLGGNNGVVDVMFTTFIIQ